MNIVEKAMECAVPSWHETSQGGYRTCAKLTWEDVDAIRYLYVFERLSLRAIASKYDLRHQTIAQVIHCKTWKPEHDPRHKEQP